MRESCHILVGGGNDVILPKHRVHHPTCTSGEEGGRYKSLLTVYKCILSLISKLGVLPFPFVTDHNTVVMLIADLFAYARAILATIKILHASNNTNRYELMNNLKFWGSYETLRRLYCSAVVRYVSDKMKELMMKLKGTEEPQNQNEMP
ncbi:hypothetical protein D8674_018349 [Pyrus ussuriensis x Pyrus communis]|uniref:Uncharacterized protein n=1 Tax=Pyrus ussuriensis x Pyrus communis TaxID=2448454 RepID=A0A5N5G559_9ROSA|nr:hypothetical protein D8674_018349 [Pyrus ussuriensis x Pyrus communis]